MEQEKKLLTEIENVEFSKKLGYFKKKLMPKSMSSRDSRAMSEGMCIPVHLYYRGIAQLMEDAVSNTQNFLDLLDRLVRQIEIKSKNRKDGATNSNYWNYINPFWLLWRIFLYAWRYKIISFISIVVSGLTVAYLSHIFGWTS